MFISEGEVLGLGGGHFRKKDVRPGMEKNEEAQKMGIISPP